MDRLFSWIRRNTRRAAALALAPGLLVLATDAWLEHFVANSGDDPLQWIPVNYGIAAAVLLALVALIKSKKAFAGIAQFVGAIGVFVGLAGTVFHLLPVLEDMGGTYDWPTLAGSLGAVGTPVFAPMAFSAMGALMFLLASPKLYLRLRVGRVRRPTGPAKVIPAPQRKAG